MDPQEMAKIERDERQAQAVYMASLMVKCAGLKTGEKFRTSEGLQTVDLKVTGPVDEWGHVPCVDTKTGEAHAIKAAKFVRKL